MKSNNLHFSNRNGSANGAAKKDKINFPVTYELKVIVELSRPKEALRQTVEEKFDLHKIPFNFLAEKPSSKGNYTSLTYKITLLDEPQMNAIYSSLKEIKEVKFAV